MKFEEKGGVSDSFLGFLAVCAHDEYECVGLARAGLRAPPIVEATYCENV